MSKSRSSKARLVITALTLENRTVGEVVADDGRTHPNERRPNLHSQVRPSGMS